MFTKIAEIMTTNTGINVKNFQISQCTTNSHENYTLYIAQVKNNTILCCMYHNGTYRIKHICW